MNPYRTKGVVMDRVSQLIRDIQNLAADNGLGETRVRIHSFPQQNDVLFRVALQTSSGGALEVLFRDSKTNSISGGTPLTGLEGSSLEGILENLLEGMQEHFGCPECPDEEVDEEREQLVADLQERFDDCEATLSDLEMERDHLCDRANELDSDISTLREDLDAIQEDLNNL